jgi:hypothetical protein
MSNVRWTKEYAIRSRALSETLTGVNAETSEILKHALKLFVSEHDDGNYFAGVLYYMRSSKPWSPIDFKIQSFADLSEKAVFNRAISWIKANIDEQARIEQVNE